MRKQRLHIKLAITSVLTIGVLLYAYIIPGSISEALPWLMLCLVVSYIAREFFLLERSRKFKLKHCLDDRK